MCVVKKVSNQLMSRVVARGQKDREAAFARKLAVSGLWYVPQAGASACRPKPRTVIVCSP